MKNPLHDVSFSLAKFGFSFPGPAVCALDKFCWSIDERRSLP